LSDIFRAYNYAADSKSVKIPDVDFDLPKVTIEEQEELPPEEAFMEFTPESFSSVEEQIIEPEEEQEKLVYPTREELAEFYRDELNAIALEVEIKAYSDALQSKKAELQNSIDSISQKINEMEELQKNFLQDYEKKLKFFAIDIAEKLVCKKIGDDDSYLSELVLKTVSECKGTNWLTVEVSDALQGLVEVAKAELSKPEYRGVAEVKPIACADDTCVVSTETGAVVATISVQADNLRLAFREAEMEV
jgi:flagellar biosynthesis/type III secretory pathway protein FliH